MISRRRRKRRHRLSHSFEEEDDDGYGDHDDTIDPFATDEDSEEKEKDAEFKE